VTSSYWLSEDAAPSRAPANRVRLLGHGNVLGLACGELVAGAILDRPAPELKLFEPARLLAV
jgi:hypothetical protein